MKKFFIVILALVMICLSLTACGNGNGMLTDGDVMTNAVDADAETTTGNDRYIVQPSNAMQKLIPGMLMCYLDYVVEDADYLSHVSVAVTPEIIQTASEFISFFATEEKPDDITKAVALYDEMTKMPEGKTIYRDADFYDSWNLIVVSVREANAETKHTIDSVSYNTDSCIFYVNGTRAVADGDGEGTVRHYVFRVPKNVYNGVSHNFTKAE